MRLWQLSPLGLKKWRQFCKVRRGYWSFWLFIGLLLFSCVAELFINHRALVVSYQGSWYFPIYGAIYSGRSFGLDYEYETDYRQLQRVFAERGEGDWVLLPVVPYGVYEMDLKVGVWVRIRWGVMWWRGWFMGFERRFGFRCFCWCLVMLLVLLWVV